MTVANGGKQKCRERAALRKTVTVALLVDSKVSRWMNTRTGAHSRLHYSLIARALIFMRRTSGFNQLSC